MIGNVIGNYKIIEKLGEGGMGAVYKGLDLMLEREVAIKVLRPELSRQPELVERFRSEAVTLARLNHPNIATLYSFFRQGEDFFMVMEFVPGQTLDAVIKRFGALPYDQAILLMSQVLEAVAHAHAMGIIHRDLKPANLMLTHTGAIKVMDFGIARALGAARMTRAGRVVGTIEYMSPEQVRGQQTDARSDIYSLGIVLYEILTGRVPFQSDSEYELMRAQIEVAPLPPRELVPQVPPAMEQVILRALAKQPEARFQTANEFQTALLAVTAPTLTANLQPGVTRIAYSINQVAGQSEFSAASLQEQTPKETRMAAHSEIIPTDANNQAKEASLAGAANAHPVVEGKTSRSPRLQSLVSFFGQRNWKLYTAAAVVLLMLISISVAVRRHTTSEPELNRQPAVQVVTQPTPRPTVAEQPVLPPSNNQSVPVAPVDWPAVNRLPLGIQNDPLAGAGEVAETKKAARANRDRVRDAAARERARRRAAALRALDQ